MPPIGIYNTKGWNLDGQSSCLSLTDLMRYYLPEPDLQVRCQLIRTMCEGLPAESLLKQKLILGALTQQLHGCFSVIIVAKQQLTPY